MSDSPSPTTPIDVVPSPQAPPEQLLVDAYYDCMRKCYWVRDDCKTWIPLEQGSLKIRLQAKGCATRPAPGYMISACDRQIMAIQQQRSVQYVGPVAGWKAGLHIMGTAKVLVTEGFKLIEPVEGEFPLWNGIIGRMLGEKQEAYFWAWVHLALMALVTGNHTLGQALVLCGPKCCGKSLVQWLITMLMGGRSARPYGYMMGKTNFNRELYGAEHLMIEDEAASLDVRTRRAFGAQIKQITATRESACHGKHMEAFNLLPFRRLTISLNDEPENVAILPPLDENMEDKLIILKAEKHAMPMPTTTPQEEAEFKAALIAEMPALMWWLLNAFQVPQEMKAPRYGIKSYAHPQLEAIIDSLAPHTRMLYIIDHTLFSNDLSLKEWSGSADDLSHKILMGDYSYQAKQMLNYPAAMGTFLGQLAKSRPKRVVKCGKNETQEWKVLRDPSLVVPKNIVDAMLEKPIPTKPANKKDEVPIQDTPDASF